MRNTALKKFVALACAFVLVLMPRLAWAPYGTGGTLNTGRFADGTQAAPSITFINETSSGIYRNGAGNVAISSLGLTQAQFIGGGISVGNLGAVSGLLTGDANNVLALRNVNTAQTFRIYNTFSDASNYERAKISWAANTLQIATEAAGTGTAREMQIGAIGNASLTLFANSTNAWRILTPNAHFVAVTDNTFDIGATGATRPRDIYSARHFRSEAATIPTMGACGTTPSVAGSDHGATITVGAGGVATSCAMNFGVSFTAAPACVVNSNTDSTAFTVTTAVGSVTIVKATAFTAGSKLYVVCMGS